MLNIKNYKTEMSANSYELCSDDLIRIDIILGYPDPKLDINELHKQTQEKQLSIKRK